MSHRPPHSPLAITAVQLGLLLFAIYYAFIGGQSAQGIYDADWRRLTLLLTGGIIGGWLLWRLLGRERIPRTPLDWPLLLLAASWLPATVLSDNPTYSRETLVFYSAYLFFFYLAADFGRRPWLRELALNAIIAVSGFVLAFAALQLSWWLRDLAAVPALGIGLPPRLSVLGNPNVMAAFLALVAPLLLAKIARTRNRPAQIVLWLWFALLLAAGLLTRSRGGLLAMLAAVTSFGGIWLLARQPDGPAAVLHRHKWRLAGGALAGLVGFAWLLTRLRSIGEGVDVRQHVMTGALQIWLQQPLLGVGPGALGQALMQYWRYNVQIWADAHNLYLTFVAETGLTGAVALAWLLLLAGRLLWRTLRREPPAQWDLTGLACAAALFGFALHNLVDSLLKTPAVMLLVAVLAGFWVSGALAAPPWPARRWNRAATGAALALLVAMLAVGLRDIRHIAAYNQGVAAAQQGNWPAALNALQTASALEPTLPFYQKQVALAAGVLAHTQPQYRDTAINAYQMALAQSDPFDRLPADAANLGCLLWQNGQPAEAIAQLRQAVAAQPNHPLYRLTLAGYLAQQGDAAAATTEYGQLLALRPDLAQSPPWADAEAGAAISRRAVNILIAGLPDSAGRLFDLTLETGQLAAARQLFTEALANGDPAAAHVARGRIFLADDDPAAARAEFTSALQTAPANASAHYYLARLALAQSRLPEAEQHAAVALALSASPANLHLAGQVAAAGGEAAQAIAYFDRAFAGYTSPADDLSLRYATEVARRRPMPLSALPCLAQPYPVPALVELTRDEAGLRRQQGNAAQAAAVYRRLLDVLPSAEIEAELDTLCREHPASCAE